MLDNWMGNAILNGIGGVPCGALEGMSSLNSTPSKLTIKSKIFDFLSSQGYKELSIKDGYISEEDYFTEEEQAEIVSKNIEIKAARYNITKEIKKYKKQILEAIHNKTIPNSNIAKLYKLFLSEPEYQQDHKNNYNHNDLNQIKLLEKQRSFLDKQQNPKRTTTKLTNKAIKTYFCMFKNNNKHIYLSPTDTHMIDTSCEKWLENL